jgi:hypothetical protein
MLINAMIGMSLLNKLYGNGLVKNSLVIENLIDSTEEEEKKSVF